MGSLGPHSWDGGLSPTTVFWVVEIPNDSVHVDLDSGSASLHAEDICVLDAFLVANSIQGINRPVNPARGIINSLRIDWTGTGGIPTPQIEPANKMRGVFVQNHAQIAVTATTPRTAVTLLSNGHGFRFVSDPASTSVNHFALIGHEQNGVFF